MFISTPIGQTRKSNKALLSTQLSHILSSFLSKRKWHPLLLLNKTIPSFCLFHGLIVRTSQTQQEVTALFLLHSPTCLLSHCSISLSLGAKQIAVALSSFPFHWYPFHHDISLYIQRHLITKHRQCSHSAYNCTSLSHSFFLFLLRSFLIHTIREMVYSHPLRHYL